MLSTKNYLSSLFAQDGSYCNDAGEKATKRPLFKDIFVDQDQDDPASRLSDAIKLDSKEEVIQAIFDQLCTNLDQEAPDYIYKTKYSCLWNRIRDELTVVNAMLARYAAETEGLKSHDLKSRLFCAIENQEYRYPIIFSLLKQRLKTPCSLIRG